MQGSHPIDERFRRKLENASLEPPARVRDGVMAALARQRYRAIWRQRLIVLSIITFLAAGVTGYWMLNEPVGDGLVQVAPNANASSAPAAIQAPTTEITNAEAGTPPSNVVAQENGQVAPNTEGIHSSTASGETGTGRPASSSVSGEKEAERSAPSSTSGEKQGPIRGAEPPTPKPFAPALPVEPLALHVDAATDRSVNAGDAGLHVREEVAAVVAEWMHGVNTVPTISDLHTTPVVARQVDYVQHKQRWWFALNATPYMERRHWSGTQTHLADVMNNAASWTTTGGFGVMGGGRWPSGFGAGVGVEVERSEQAYKHHEQNVVEENTIITNYITLNTTVYAASYDTVVTPVTQDLVAEGSDSRTTLRIPLELSWQNSCHRWIYGIRAGVVAELNNVRSSSSLVQDGADGHISAARLDEAELRSRYPASVLGSAGVDFGYLFHERWALLATPLYMRGIEGSNVTDPLGSTPERFGLRFQLCHTW